MASEYLTCKLCGFEFSRQDTLCQHGCPLGALCNLVRCPSCGYEFPLKPHGIPWFQRLFRRKQASEEELCNVTTLRDLKRGDRGRVLCIGSESSPRSSNLAVFGLVPGADVELEQQHPSCVIRVEETELALDSDIAREILVEKRES